MKTKTFVVHRMNYPRVLTKYSGPHRLPDTYDEYKSRPLSYDISSLADWHGLWLRDRENDPAKSGTRDMYVEYYDLNRQALDGVVTRIKGREDGDRVYGVLERDEWVYEERYDAGPADLAYMLARDQYYLSKLLRLETLRKEEPGVWYLWEQERTQGTDIGAWWSVKLKLPNIDAILEQATADEKKFGDKLAIEAKERAEREAQQAEKDKLLAPLRAKLKAIVVDAKKNLQAIQSCNDLQLLPQQEQAELKNFATYVDEINVIGLDEAALNEKITSVERKLPFLSALPQKLAALAEEKVKAELEAKQQRRAQKEQRRKESAEKFQQIQGSLAKTTEDLKAEKAQHAAGEAALQKKLDSRATEVEALKTQREELQHRLELLSRQLQQTKAASPKLIDSLIAQGNVADLKEVLASEQVDLQALSLVHLKDEFTDAEKLHAKGAIMSLQQLLQAMDHYIARSKEDLSAKRYLKRLSQGIDLLLSSWKNGTIANLEVQQQLDLVAAANLETLWKKLGLNSALCRTIEDKIEQYKAQDVQRWRGAEANAAFDTLIVESILSKWKQEEESTNPLFPLLKQLAQEQLITHFKNKLINPDEFATTALAEVKNKLSALLTAGAKTLNKQLKDLIGQEYKRILSEKDEIIYDHKPLIEEAIMSVLAKWSHNELPAEIMGILNDIVSQVCSGVAIPEGLRSTLDREATGELLIRYKNRSLDDAFVEGSIGAQITIVLKLAQPSEGQIKHALSDVLADWKAGKIADPALDRELVVFWRDRQEAVNTALQSLYTKPIAIARPRSIVDAQPFGAADSQPKVSYAELITRQRSTYSFVETVIGMGQTGAAVGIDQNQVKTTMPH